MRFNVMSVSRVIVLIAASVFLLACGQESNQDVQQFIDENKRRPPGKVPSLPVYSPYKPYEYNAAQFRSPFEPPALVEKKIIAAKSNVKPDLSRQKQYLESFDFNSLAMVGTIEKDGILWALIRDPSGSIESVRKGAYLGKNHGKIVALNSTSIDVVEIIPNGSDSWLERPNVLSMKQLN